METKFYVPDVRGFSLDVRKQIEERLQYERRDNEEAIAKRAARLEPGLSADKYDVWRCGEAYIAKLMNNEVDEKEQRDANPPPVLSSIIIFGLAASGLLAMFAAIPVPKMTSAMQFFVSLFSLAFAFSTLFVGGTLLEACDRRNLRQQFLKTGFSRQFREIEFISNTSTLCLFGDKALFVEGQERRNKLSKAIFYDAIGDIEQRLEDGYVTIAIFGKDGTRLVKISDPVSGIDGSLDASHFVKILRSKCAMTV